MLVKEIVYYILDACKAISDDVIVNEEEVLFLLKRYRAFLIKKDKEENDLDSSSEFEYQEICLDLEKVPAMDGEPCTGGYYLRTKQKIPKVLAGTTPRVYPMDFYQGINVVYIPRDRMRYVGTNRYLQNIIWVSLGADNHLYLFSNNPQFFYLKKLRMLAIFEDFDEATDLLCDCDCNDKSCDVLDAVFPIKDYLVPQLIEACEKEILGIMYRPADTINNAKDDLADLASFVRRNMKSDMQQQIEG